jgi:PTS system nitrogen regulatory IIA component
MYFSLSAIEDKPVVATTGRLAEAMARGGVHRGIGGVSVEDVLKNSVTRLTLLPAPVRDELYERLVSREQLSSTGIGRGVAIPHPRSPLNQSEDLPFIATCYLDAPLDFKAVDHRPVFVLFILVGDSIDSHLRLLSRLAFCLRDDAFVSFLRDQPGMNLLLARIEGFERQLAENG